MLPEQRLVVAASRSALTGASLDLLVEQATVGPAVAFADELGVVGLVSDYMRTTAAADPLWTEVWRANAARNVMLVFELRQWVLALRQAGIEPVVFKGPVLAKTAFGSLARRDSCDLDLIAPLHQFRAAVEVCRRLGGTPLVEPGDSDEHLGAVTMTVARSVSTFAIDLHAGWLPIWGHLPNRTIPDEDLREIDMGGVKCTTLGPELSFIHAASHFWQHGFALKMVADVVATLKRVRVLGLEEQCLERARVMGILRAVTFAIRAADQFATQGRVSGPGVMRWCQLPIARTRSNEDLTFILTRELVLDRSWREVGAIWWKRIWPSEAYLQLTPEWVGTEHPAMRRMLRPLRLLTRSLRLFWTRQRASWRRRPPLRFQSQDATSGKPTS